MANRERCLAPAMCAVTFTTLDIMWSHMAAAQVCAQTLRKWGTSHPGPAPRPAADELEQKEAT